MNKYLKKILPPVIGSYYNTLAYVAPGLAGKKAFYTFATTRKGRVLPQQQPFLDNARKERLRAGTHEVQVYEWPGDGETVLLLHGWESNVYRWRNLIQYLREAGCNVVAFDAPGHGYSNGKILTVPIYSECTSAVIAKYRPHHLIGHSVGGMNAIYTLANGKDDRIKKVVTLGSPNEFHEIVNDYQGLLRLNKRVFDALDDYIYSLYQFRIREFNSARFAGALRQEGLLIHDLQDKIIPFYSSRQVHEAWPKSKLIATEGLGHSLHQEAVNRRIVHFITS